MVTNDQSSRIKYQRQNTDANIYREKMGQICRERPKAKQHDLMIRKIQGYTHGYFHGC